MHMRLSEAVERVRKTSRWALPDKVGSPCFGADAAPRGIEPVEDIPGKKGAGRGMLLRAVSLVEYVLLISCMSLVILLAGPGVADSIQGQFGTVANAINAGPLADTNGGNDFPGGGSGGAEDPDNPGAGVEKPVEPAVKIVTWADGTDEEVAAMVAAADRGEIDNATEAGRMLFGRVTESKLFSQLRAHYRFEARFCNPDSGNEKGSVENAVGFPRRNLLVPVPSVPSLDALNSMLLSGCRRINATAKSRLHGPAPKAFAEDLAAMMALPGVRFDSVRWVHVRSDKRGYIQLDGVSYCAGPARHSRDLLAGARARTVEIMDMHGRHVASLPRSWKQGELVRNPASLVPALVARPRAFGESVIRRDMPEALLSHMDRLEKDDLRRALRAIGRASDASGFDAACQAAERLFAEGRVPDDASCDVLARRIASGGAEGAGVDLAAYDRLAGKGGSDGKQR